MKTRTKSICYSITLILLIGSVDCSSDAGSNTDGVNNNSIIDEPYSKDIFIDNFNGTEIDSAVWQVAGWMEHGGQTGPERCFVKNGCLNLIFKNDSVLGFLSSAVQTRKEFLYGKWEARLKPSGVSGILNSMYTIDWDNMTTASPGDDGTKQEIDIEFLTKSFTSSNGEVHFAVHAAGRTSFNLNPDLKLGFNPSDDFHIWAIEITSEFIKWSVDGKLLHTYAYSSGDININGPYQLKFNVWSENGGWVGGPPALNTECVYQIDWIKFTPYEK